MEVLEIAEGTGSPRVVLDPNGGTSIFEGRSLPEDPMDFYGPVLNWFEQYKENPASGAMFEFKLTYFNTASSKIFFHIIQVIDKINIEHTGVENQINIYTSEDDDDLKELFEYYKELLSSNCLHLKIY